MKTLSFALAIAIFPFAAQAGEALTYVVDGETFEGYRSAAKSDSKGFVVIVHDWDGLTEYEMRRADMLADMGYDAFAVDLFRQGQPPNRLHHQEEGDRQALSGPRAYAQPDPWRPSRGAQGE